MKKSRESFIAGDAGESIIKDPDRELLNIFFQVQSTSKDIQPAIQILTLPSSGYIKSKILY